MVENVSNERDREGNEPAEKREAGTLAQAIHAIATARENRVESATSAARQGTLPQGDSNGREMRNETESRLAERFAMDNQLWIPFEKIFTLGRPGQSGNENDIYISENGYVYKVNNLVNSGGSTLRLLHKIRLHNLLFPETAYVLIGFTGFIGRSIYPVLRQRRVESADNSTIGEIDNFMLSIGFTKIGEFAYKKGDIEVSDLRPRNVLKDTDGELYVIDAEIIEKT